MAGNAQFEAFAAHGFDKDAKLQFAAACYFKAILVVAFCHANGDIRFRFTHQTITDHAAGDLAALSSGHGRVIDGEAHRQRRWVDWLGIDRLADRNISYRIGNRRNGKRSEEHTSELQSLMRISYAVFCLKKKKQIDH